MKLAEHHRKWARAVTEILPAWELYIELITRVTVVELRPEEGLAREALTSLYSVFGSTREILRKYGPEVAPRGRDDAITFGMLAIGSSTEPCARCWRNGIPNWRLGKLNDPTTSTPCNTNATGTNCHSYVKSWPTLAPHSPT